MVWFFFVGFGLHVWLVAAMGKDYCALVVFIWLALSSGLGLVMWYYMVPFFNKLFYELDNDIQDVSPEQQKLINIPSPTDINRDLFLTDQHPSHYTFYF